MKITEYPQATEFDIGDVLLKDGTNGTKKILASDLAFALFDGIPEMHNQIFRGKNLGSSVSSEQYSAIQDGSFSGLWLGDYWEIDGIKYRIVDFDYFYNFSGSSDGTYLTSHHANIVPDVSMTTAKMHTKTGNNAGFIESNIYKSVLSTINSTLNSAFSNKILPHVRRLSSGMSYYNSTYRVGSASASSKVTVNSCLMNTKMIKGYMGDLVIKGWNGTSGTFSTEDVDDTQFSLFAKCPKFIPTSDHKDYWTCVMTLWQSDYCRVTSDGGFGTSINTTEYGVRPEFCIG